jgi:hypothetical protein
MSGKLKLVGVFQMWPFAEINGKLKFAGQLPGQLL